MGGIRWLGSTLIRRAALPIPEDHALIVEGVHAEWKLVEQQWRGVRLPYINAIVKLRRYITSHGSLPDADRLIPFIRIYRADMRRQYMQLVNDPNTASGFYSRFLHDDRFNLSPMDAALTRDVGVGVAAGGEAMAGDDARDYEWGLYLRFLFEPMCFYKFSRLGENRVLFVGETKSFVGRSAPGPAEVTGRKLAIAWFTIVDNEADVRIVVPCDSDFEGTLSLQRRSRVEISAPAGFHPPVAPDQSARDTERLHHGQVFVCLLMHEPHPALAGNTTAMCGNGRSLSRPRRAYIISTPKI